MTRLREKQVPPSNSGNGSRRGPALFEVPLFLGQLSVTPGRRWAAGKKPKKKKFAGKGRSERSYTQRN